MIRLIQIGFLFLAVTQVALGAAAGENSCVLKGKVQAISKNDIPAAHKGKVQVTLTGMKIEVGKSKSMCSDVDPNSFRVIYTSNTKLKVGAKFSAPLSCMTGEKMHGCVLTD